MRIQLRRQAGMLEFDEDRLGTLRAVIGDNDGFHGNWMRYTTDCPRLVTWFLWFNIRGGAATRGVYQCG
jgi:hypothetical protein